MGRWLASCLRAAPITALFVLTPLGVTSRGEVAVTRGCAQELLPSTGGGGDGGTCCPERRSICNIGGGDNLNYYKRRADGSCNT